MTELNRRGHLLGLFISALMIGACNKNGDDVPVTLPTANLNVINAVTDVRAINFYLNGTRQNNTSAIYLYNASGYLAVTKGQQRYQFKNDTNRAVLADIPLDLTEEDASYTLVVAGQQRKGTLTPILIKDEFTTDSVATNARVRFVQAAPGNSLYDVFVGDTLAFKGQAFKGATAFFSVGAGKKTVKVRLAGTGTEIFNGPVILNQGRYYTMYTTGEQGGADKNAFNVSANLSR